MQAVEVRSRVPGTATDAVPSVRIEVHGARMTLRALITGTVEAQVVALAADAGRCRAALDRQFLTDADIRDQARGGAVRLPSVPVMVDAGVEARRACDAFVAGVFVVFVGGQQVTELDAEVRIGPAERVTFLRLTPLQGG